MINWNDDLIADMRKLWDAGMSPAGIAKRLGEGFTPSAVSGKIHRLGWKRQLDVVDGLARTLNARKGAAVTNAIRRGLLPPGNVNALAPPSWTHPRRAMPIDAGPLPGSQPRHWLSRQVNECAWPVAGEGADVSSCCLPTARRSQYCMTHAWRFSHGHKPMPAHLVCEAVAAMLDPEVRLAA